MNFSVWSGIEARDFSGQHVSLDAFGRFSGNDREQFAADEGIVHVANSYCRSKSWLRVAGDVAKNCSTAGLTGPSRDKIFRNSQADTDFPNALFRRRELLW